MEVGKNIIYSISFYIFCYLLHNLMIWNFFLKNLVNLGCFFLWQISFFFFPFLHVKISHKFASAIKVASIYNIYFGKNLLTYFNYNQNKEIDQTNKH
jgi:hypothetical protein